jgi:hypothetical protein
MIRSCPFLPFVVPLGLEVAVKNPAVIVFLFIMLIGGAWAITSPGEAVQATPVCSVRDTIMPGDTLGSIAIRYGTTVQELAAKNGIEDPNVIREGELLCIKE